MKTPPEAMLLDHQMCFALYRASRAMTRAYAPLLEPLGLTYPQYLTLLALWEEDGASMKRLGERLTLDSATLTPLLKRLEVEGVVERRRDLADERVVRVYLTKRGRALQGKAQRVPTAMACKVGGAADSATLKKLARLREELVALAETLDRGGVMPGLLVTIESFVNVTSASLARARLEAEGIHCHVANEHLAGLRDGFGPAMIQVHEEDAERALAILREKIDAPPVDPEDGPVCPKCHGQYAESERALGSWLLARVTFGRVPVRTHWRCRKCGNAWEPEAPKGDPYRT